MNTDSSTAEPIVKEIIPDVLAQRYASTPMVNLWGPRNRVILERKFWLAVLQGQSRLGVHVPDVAFPAYANHVGNIDFASIKRRELKTKQDVVARVEEFNALAGFELIGIGLTSRDTTDNVEQFIIRTALEHVGQRVIAVAERFGRKATEFALLDLSGRSHNVAGQTITLGKRFANFAEELLIAYNRLEHFIASYPLRGIKGAMGTQQDMADILGSAAKVRELEEYVRIYLGFGGVLDSVGQVYPRSLDFETVSVLAQLGSSMGNLAKMIRLMAGQDLLHEGFRAGQTGSFAQPHKINSRTAERLNGSQHVLGGFLDMTQSLLGDQWNEGDVSCSIIRRVAMQGAFFVFDGMCEATLHILDEMEVFPEMVQAELKRYLPFLSTTRLLMAACKKGKGRDPMHSLIKKHAVVALTVMRRGKGNPFLETLSADREFPLSPAEITALTAEPNHGLAPEQIEKVCGKIAVLTERFPEAATYAPEPML